MEKYINSLIRGFKKIFNKKYFAILSVFIGVVTVLGFSYGFLASESGWQLAAQLRIRKLYYSIAVNGTATNEISIPANSGTTYYNVEITSLNDINTRYALAYRVSGTATVKVSSASTNAGSGIIGLYSTGTNTEKKKTVRIAVTNTSSSTATVTLSVAGGYTWNPEGQVSLATGYTLVSGINNEAQIGMALSLAEEVDTILNCTPTASVPCYYTNNSNNYVEYAGHTWRIIGTYLVDSKPVLKLILNEPLTNKVTYANVSSALTTFYNGLSDTSLIQGSATSLTKAEYDAIGGVNSYLYTKPDKDYWTGTQYYVGTSRGAVNKNSSYTAYVRPVIQLKAEVINFSSGELGTSTNPYNLVLGVRLNITNMLYGTTNLVSGYYIGGQTYTLNTPVSTNSNFRFGSWSVSGTGASVDDTTFVMGTTETTLTASWVEVRTITYSCDGGSGTAPAAVIADLGTTFEVPTNNITQCKSKIVTGSGGFVYYQSGWASSSGGSAISSFSVTANQTLYAVWNKLFTYGGTYSISTNASGAWLATFTSSGNVVFNRESNIDIHVTGGGGGGGGVRGSTSYGGAGGGGGGATKYVTTGYNASGTIAVTVGNGGSGGSVGNGGSGGETSSFGSLVSAGGGSGGKNSTYSGGTSQGGASGAGSSTTGGTLTGISVNGSNGGAGGGGNANGSNGANGTAYLFGLSSNGSTLYGAGGGGGAFNGRTAGSGGTTGGGNGNGGSGGAKPGYAATPNTGSGGGGGSGGSGTSTGGNGGSGIVIIREHKVVDIPSDATFAFDYTGNFKVNDDSTIRNGTYYFTSTDWKVYFVTSGDLTILKSASIDIHVTGGGGGGGGVVGATSHGGAGGGGGGATKYVATGYEPSGTISVTVGNGGYGASAGNAGGSGGTSSFGSLVTAAGGSGGRNSYYGSGTSYGGNGGSGGSTTDGSLTGISFNGAGGGAGGAKGETGTSGGSGPTYLFGLSSNGSTLYGAGGGGGGGEKAGGSGGTTGGGSGASGTGGASNGGAATDNTGAGGGGASGGNGEGTGGKGGSGVVIIRNHTTVSIPNDATYAFNYTGNFTVNNDSTIRSGTYYFTDTNWEVYFVTSGDLTILKSASIDIHVTGGGGGGGGVVGATSHGGAGGGGGGATKYVTSGYVATGDISITVGNGGSASSVGNPGGDGGTSSFGTLVTAGGGYGGRNSTYSSGTSQGGAGGARGTTTGGSLTGTSVNGATGGAGGARDVTGSAGGTGTAYPFGSSANGSTQYGAGGGGGGGEKAGGSGGTTGGGAGASGTGGASNGYAATANTGSGGGGASGGNGEGSGGKGGSGVIIIRNHR